MQFSLKINLIAFLIVSIVASSYALADAPSRKSVKELLLSIKAVESMQLGIQSEIDALKISDPQAAMRAESVVSKLDKDFYLNSLIDVYSAELNSLEVKNLNDLYSGDVGKKYRDFILTGKPKTQMDFYSNFTKYEQKQILSRLNKVGAETFKKVTGDEFANKASSYVLSKVSALISSQ